MTFPESLSETLTTIGQAAVEVECGVPEYREFVTIYRARTNAIPGFRNQFPYLDGLPIVFRVIRFRVDAALLAEDYDFCNEDLVGLQEIYLPSESAVEFILGLWQVSLESFRPPNQTEVPV
jgi:hypothetical protein